MVLPAVKSAIANQFALGQINSSVRSCKDGVALLPPLQFDLISSNTSRFFFALLPALADEFRSPGCDNQ